MHCRVCPFLSYEMVHDRVEKFPAGRRRMQEAEDVGSFDAELPLAQTISSDETKTCPAFCIVYIF